MGEGERIPFNSNAIAQKGLPNRFAPDIIDDGRKL